MAVQSSPPDVEFEYPAGASRRVLAGENHPMWTAKHECRVRNEGESLGPTSDPDDTPADGRKLLERADSLHRGHQPKGNVTSSVCLGPLILEIRPKCFFELARSHPIPCDPQCRAGVRGTVAHLP